MSVVTVDLELPSSLPAAKGFHAGVLDFDNLVPKVAPQAYKSVEILQGDGGVGTIKLIKFGQGIPFETIKVKVEAIDKEKLSASIKVIEGDLLMDILESVTYEIHFVGSASGDGGSIYKHRTIHNVKAGKELKEEHIQFGKDQTTQVFKAVDDFLLANPNAY